MWVDKVMQNKKEIMKIVDDWSRGNERLVVFEKDDTLVLKKMKKSLASFADNSYGDEMNLEEIVAEVHKVRHSL